ncbi:MAG: mechanosensitive ion channel family protein [Gemmatimonadales bacterium]
MLTTLLLAVVLQTPSAPAPPDSAVLTIENRPIAIFRGRVGLTNAGDRVAAGLRRIDAAFRTDGNVVTVQYDTVGTLVLLNGHAVIVMTTGDLAPTDPWDVREAADSVAARLQLALAERLEERSVRTLVRELASTALATVLLLLALRLLGWLGRTIGARVAGAAPRIAVGGFNLLRKDQLETGVKIVLHALAWIVTPVLLYLYAVFVLTRWPYTRPWGEATGGFLRHTLTSIGLGILHALPSLVVIGIIVWLTRLGTRLLNTFFEAVAAGRARVAGFHPDTAMATRRISVAMLWVFAAAAIYPNLPGSGTDAFKGISILAGVLVTFGSSGLAGQAMSGLQLVYARGFKVGDFIKVGEVEGTVLELGLLSTRLRTVWNEIVAIPNSVVVSGAVTDYSSAAHPGTPVFITGSVTIGYDVPWRTVHDLLLKSAGEVEGLASTPAPLVLQQALDDSYVSYQVGAAMAAGGDSSRVPVLRSELKGKIQDVFNEAGVEILSPSFYALRDGNESSIPADHRPPASAKSFRIDTHPGPG